MLFVRPSTMAQQITFAGVTTKITSRGLIRRPAYLKMLRSGRVRLSRTNLTTDCDQTDAAHKRDAMADPDVLVRLADDIEQHPDGWWADIEPDGKLRVCCHTFLSYRIEEVTAG